MLFPDTGRVIYAKNPLVEVICQLRYPSILRIDTSEPVDFQERIRREFPIYHEKSTSTHLPQEIAQLIPAEMAKSLRSNQKAYEFATLDSSWSISLTRDFVALTCLEYVRWEEFLAKLEIPFSALSETYSPSAFTRIGLRYQNLIRRSGLGLQGVDWSDLINSVLASFLSSPEQMQSVEDTTHVTLLRLDDYPGKVRIRHGLARDDNTGEECYLIDSDFFTEGIEDIENGLSIVNEFNRRNRNLFRWCITDALHKSMEPNDI